MSESPDQPGAPAEPVRTGVPGSGNAPGDEGAAEFEAGSREAEAAAARAAAEADPGAYGGKPPSQVEGEALAAAQPPPEIIQPVPGQRDTEAESAARYREAGIEGAPGSEVTPGEGGGDVPPA